MVAHSLTAVARDASGNLTTSSAVTVIVTNNSAPDNTPPTVSITSPAVNATVSGSVTISASASDNVGVAGLQFKVDGANLGPEQTGADVRDLLGYHASLEWEPHVDGSGAR